MDDDINQYVPSILNPRSHRKSLHDSTLLTQNSLASRCSLSLRRSNVEKCFRGKKHQINKENIHAGDRITRTKNAKSIKKLTPSTTKTVTLFAKNQPKQLKENKSSKSCDPNLLALRNERDSMEKKEKNIIGADTSVISVSSSGTGLYSLSEFPSLNEVKVSFDIHDCDNIDVRTETANIKQISLARTINNMHVDCKLTQGTTKTKTDSDSDDQEINNIDQEESARSVRKRSAVTVNLEIKKKKKTSPTDETSKKTKVLILKTDTVEKVSRVVVQPSNYKLVKKNISETTKRKGLPRNLSGDLLKNGKNCNSSSNLKQKCIDSYFNTVKTDVVKSACIVNGVSDDVLTGGDEVSMNKTSVGSTTGANAKCRATKSAKTSSPRPKVESSPTKRRSGKTSPELRRSPASSYYATSRSNSPLIQNSQDPVYLAQRPTTANNKLERSDEKNVPRHKIVSGTHFAVDAFSYGDIPNVTKYFLTHFHSDHYGGLKKTFNKTLLCSKVTAELCIKRLGVDPKCIQILMLDDTTVIDGIEVTALDANHCPGAIMLVFTLTNGKTVLHTGDFRATPDMECYPIFWNKDIHTIYLDTTYCNPRYDFPSQDQSLEMALFLLRQKKLAVEKEGKKFSSVLIVCGTYTIGKEKFFMGVARRVGCKVWACPEKERVLRVVEGRGFDTGPPKHCQLHVVPMRDLTVEKLKCYLDSLQGAYSEVVAFKPSGWENGRHSNIEKERVTIYGIPYSEHSSFSEMIRFVKFLNPKQVVPTVKMTGSIKQVEKHFPCRLLIEDNSINQTRMTDHYSTRINRQQIAAVT